MRKTVFLLASLFVMVLATQRVNAQINPSATANATATILEAVSIENQADLKFGKIIPDADGGTVTVASDGNRYANGVLLFDTESDHQAASFKVSGTAGRTYSLSFPASATLTRSGGSETMTVNGFANSHSASGTLNASGEETFNVGGTLTVGANQTPGSYIGTFTVTAAYN